MNPTNDVDATDPVAVLALFASIARRAAAMLASNHDWSGSGRREAQYAIDVEIDHMCVDALHAAGLDVLSEESGITRPDGAGGRGVDRVVVVDPLDGSTNAALGLPWCATALCLVADGQPEVALVRNLRTGDVYSAVRGWGATSRGQPLRVGDAVPLGAAIVAANARPPDSFRPRQFRCTGSTALDIVSVARGGFDGSVDFDAGMIGVWDYLAATLIVEEAGGVCADALGRPLVTLDPAERRRPVVASSSGLLDELLAVG